VETSTVNIGTTIAVVADMNNLVFEGQIDESEVGKLHEGQELELTIGAIENITFGATLEYIAPKGSQQSEGSIQFAFRAARKPQQKAVIRAGYSANAKIILDKREHVLALPESVILFDKQQKPYVELETNPQTFERRSISLGLSDGLKVEVTSGLTISDKVKDIK
jgi:HlyD family secretion protein